MKVDIWPKKMINTPVASLQTAALALQTSNNWPEDKFF
jgi:hypothetical protein